MILSELISKVNEIKEEVSKVIIGQEEAIEKSIIAILAGQHVLIEGVPGIAKTLMVKTLGLVMNAGFGRIQFTPDLMPSDILGTNIFNLKENEFTLVKGPVFTTFLLSDEINRAPAKTQSALLEAMQEREVTIDKDTHTLSEHFTVFATQNPIEHEGTYPLPEAQKDRFMLKIKMDYPSSDNELELAKKFILQENPEAILKSGNITRIVSENELKEMKTRMFEVSIKDEILEYIVSLVRKTRNYESILVGAGPRAVQSLILASRGCAIVNGRDYVIPDDVKAMVASVLEHRIILHPEFEIEGVTIEESLANLVNEVKVPR